MDEHIVMGQPSARIGIGPARQIERVAQGRRPVDVIDVNRRIMGHQGGRQMGAFDFSGQQDNFVRHGRTLARHRSGRELAKIM